MKKTHLIISKTFYFWIAIRIIIIFFFSASLFNDRHETIQFKTLWAFFYYFFFQLYIVTLFILLIQFLLRRKRTIFLKLFVSAYSIYYSIITSIELYNQKQNSYYLILPALLFLYGVWQLFFDKTYALE